MRILIVEEDAGFGDTLRDFLRAAGHDPQVVASAAAALHVVRQSRPDFMFLGVRLPGMSGLDLLQLTLVRQSRVPIVVVSGEATPEEARACLRLGALEFLPKPVPLERLREIVDWAEPLALLEATEMAGRLRERRRASRARVAVPVQVQEYAGPAWEAVSVDLSSSGVKLGPTRPVQPGAIGHLVFKLPPELAEVRVLSLLVRSDADGHAFHFANLTAEQAERLRVLRAPSATATLPTV